MKVPSNVITLYKCSFYCCNWTVYCDSRGCVYIGAAINDNSKTVYYIKVFIMEQRAEVCLVSNDGATIIVLIIFLSF